MFIINRDNKQSKKIEAITFSSLGLKERDDLQEWIVKEPTILRWSLEYLASLHN